MTRHVVVHTRDVVASRMAGPGLRAFHLASELARHHDVRLVAELADGFARENGLDVAARGTPEADRFVREADVVIGQPTKELLAAGNAKRRVFDLFDPVVLELPAIYANRRGLRGRMHQWIEWRRLDRALGRADLLIAATEAQFSFYTGVRVGTRAATPEWLGKWLTIPFGIEERDPAADGEPIDLGDGPVAIWGGGTWPWLDPDMAVEAVRRVRERGGRLRLLFMGGRRPNAEVDRAAGLWRPSSDEAILRNPEWVPYRDRARWLRSSRIAIMLHKESLEARFSIRTRLFDAIWCGVPIIASEGGFAAELVEREQLGLVVKIGDVEGVVDAFERLTGDDAFHARCVENLARIRPRFSWSEVVRPLAEGIERLP